MSKAREKLVEARRREIAAMDTIICLSEDRAAIEGWNGYVRDDFRAAASDDLTYEACCEYFMRVINEIGVELN